MTKCDKFFLLLISTFMLVGVSRAQEDSIVQEKHIYDSSENFFNWRDDIDEAYYIIPSNKNQRASAKIAAYKKDEKFWYVNAIENIENKYILYGQRKDSLNNVNKNRKDQKQSNASKETARENNVDEEVSVMVDGQSYFTPSVWVTILLLLLVLFGGFIFLNKDNVLLRKNNRTLDKDDRKADENIFSISYATAILSAEQAGDYTKAIRLQYLEIIKLMSEAGIIAYQPDLTNMNYLAQLRRSQYKDGFITVTRHYEFSWYGKLSVTEPIYKRIRDDFAAFKTTLG